MEVLLCVCVCCVLSARTHTLTHPAFPIWGEVFLESELDLRCLCILPVCVRVDNNVACGCLSVVCLRGSTKILHTQTKHTNTQTHNDTYTTLRRHIHTHNHTDCIEQATPVCHLIAPARWRCCRRGASPTTHHLSMSLQTHHTLSFRDCP